MDFLEICRNGFGRADFVEKHGLTNFQLKCIAMVSMVLDHLAAFLMPHTEIYYLFRKIGRLSFPILAFLIVEGLIYTKSRKKYAARLLLFAFISEIPFDLATTGKLLDTVFSHQNVFFTLFLGMLAIWAMDELKKSRYGAMKELVLAGQVLITIVACALAWILRTDYSYAGVILIILFYIMKNIYALEIFSNVFFNVGLYSGIQKYGIFSIVFLSLYSGKAGTRRFKYFFYAFYPLHLLLIVAIRYIIFGG